MPRDFAQEHRDRKLITPEQRIAREERRAKANAAKIEAGELSWSSGNEKLAKLGILSFGIPAGVAADGFNTCPRKGDCAEWCYARQGFYYLPHVQAAHERNLAIVRADLDRFVQLALRDLGIRKRPKIVRIHDSGDFFSTAYLRAWLTIARRLPEIRFYAYTKMFHRFHDVFAIAPKNFRMIQSFGGLDDAHVQLGKPHARVFVSHADREAAGYVDGTETDQPALDGVVKIGLVHHGTKRLTEPQRAALRVIHQDQVRDVPEPKPAQRVKGEPLPPDTPPFEAILTDPPPMRDVADVERTIAIAKVAAEQEETRHTSQDDPPPPDRDGRAVTVYLTRKQVQLLDLLLDAGVYGDTDESACTWLLVEGLTRHFKRAFKAQGFTP